jgi:DNA ligase-1
MRRFEYRDQKSNKFWEIEQDGVELIARWGRIGTTGQSGRKRYASEAKAAAELDKQVRSKLDKGYVELVEEKPAAKKPAAKKATAKKATAKKATAKQPATDKPAVEASPEKQAAMKKVAEQVAAKKAAAAQAVIAPGDLPDGGQATVSGSGSNQYILRNSGGAYSCTCPAWRNQSATPDRRTCKHLRKFRGEAAEEARMGGALPQRAVSSGDSGANAPPLLLAHRWEEQDPTGWWLSEKLDGVRAYWDGKQFISRLGNAYLAPDWFIEGLPEFPLDGELFAGRGRFQHAG